MALKAGTKTIHLKCGHFEANINGMDADDFPAIPTVAEGTRCSISARNLRSAINQTVFAAATDDTRPVLAGVLLTVKDDEVTFAAADGFRLAVRTVQLAEAAPEELSLLIPARSLNELARIIVDSDELVPGRVDVLASSAEMGDNAGQLDASVEGEETQIAFNVRYLRDALDALSGGEVALEVTGPTSPGLLKPISGTGHLHVIMPMHVSR